MKILKKGRADTEIKGTGSCSHCKCKIECTMSECETFYDSRGNVNLYSYLCPCCKRFQIWIEFKK